MALENIKVRAKVVLVISEMDMNTGQEIKQSTVKYRVTDTLTEAEVATLHALYKAGKVIP
jgi:hypothetical protein